MFNEQQMMIEAVIKNDEEHRKKIYNNFIKKNIKVKEESRKSIPPHTPDVRVRTSGYNIIKKDHDIIKRKEYEMEIDNAVNGIMDSIERLANEMSDSNYGVTSTLLYAGTYIVCVPIAITGLFTYCGCKAAIGGLLTTK